MALLAEAISVVVRADAILRVFGGFDSFKASVPNETLCADNEIVRVGFMSPDDVKTYVELLATHGLVFLEQGTARDFVVVDQQRGPTARCDWLDFGHVNLGGDPKCRIAACRLKGSDSLEVVMPEGWRFEGSLSQTFRFVPSTQVDKAAEYLGTEVGLDVYRSNLTGLKGFVGRAFGRRTK